MAIQQVHRSIKMDFYIDGGAAGNNMVKIANLTRIAATHIDMLQNI